MPVEMIGWIAPRVSSEIIPAEEPAFSANVVAETARIHEDANFDRVLIGYFSVAPFEFILGAHAANVTERLGFLLAHRPGFMAPTVATRKLATLDQLRDGRLAVHIISGGRDGDQAKDGDYVDHPGRYRRSAEYVDILRRVWTETHPFDHEGEFYKFEAAHADIRCASDPHIPIYGGGGSDAAVDLLSPWLDVFMLWGEPLADTAAFMARVRNAAKGRRISFSLSTHPILAETDDKAWDRARDILTKVTERTGGATNPNNRTAENIGSQRLLAAAEASDVHDTCLWMELAAATGARGNSTAVVGTPDTVAAALLEYYKLGATSLLIRGYDPRPDAVQYGRELIPCLRQLVADYEAAQSAA